MLGDHTFIGWLTTVGYFAAAWLCLRAARSPASGRCGLAKRLRAFWVLLVAMLVALGLNKQLDLQALLTKVGRHMARAGGWYHRKREVERWFVVSVGTCGVMVAVLFGWLTRRCLWPSGLALVGIVSLVCFVLLRASSFHHVDRFLGQSVGASRMAWILELSGIACIVVSAYLYPNWRRRGDGWRE